MQVIKSKGGEICENCKKKILKNEIFLLISHYNLKIRNCNKCGKLYIKTWINQSKSQLAKSRKGFKVVKREQNKGEWRMKPISLRYIKNIKQTKVKEISEKAFAFRNVLKILEEDYNVRWKTFYHLKCKCFGISSGNQAIGLEEKNKIIFESKVGIPQSSAGFLTSFNERVSTHATSNIALTWLKKRILEHCDIRRIPLYINNKDLKDCIVKRLKRQK